MSEKFHKTCDGVKRLICGRLVGVADWLDSIYKMCQSTTSFPFRLCVCVWVSTAFTTLPSKSSSVQRNHIQTHALQSESHGRVDKSFLCVTRQYSRTSCWNGSNGTLFFRRVCVRGGHTYVHTWDWTSLFGYRDGGKVQLHSLWPHEADIKWKLSNKMLWPEIHCRIFSCRNRWNILINFSDYWMVKSVLCLTEQFLLLLSSYPKWTRWSEEMVGNVATFPDLMPMQWVHFRRYCGVSW